VRLETLVGQVLDRAEEENRFIVAWSEHDLKKVRTYCSATTGSRFEARYRNARAFAEDWGKKLHPEWAFRKGNRKENALANYLDMIGYEVPAQFGPNLVGEYIRRLTPPMAGGKSWGSLSNRQRSYWTDMLGHNQHDCVGMFEVCHQAATELEAKAQTNSARPFLKDPSREQRHQQEDEGDVESMNASTAEFGSFTLRDTGERRPLKGETTAGVASSGMATVFEVSGEAFRVEVGLISWLTGDQDVQMLGRIAGDEPLDGLTRRLRISIKDHGDLKWLELEQARIDSVGWIHSYKATLNQLDEGAGVSTVDVISRLGGEVGSREDLLGDAGRRRSWMCAAFPKDATLVPVAAFTISRIAPVLESGA
jgi:hypothetical protein